MNNTIDDELAALAELALRNAFYGDFSALVNKYVITAQGLGFADFQVQLNETANVFSRDYNAQSGFCVSIWTQNAKWPFNVVNHNTIFDALTFADAEEVYVQNQKVFERRNGEWFFVG